MNDSPISPSEPLTILIAEDHEWARIGLSMSIEKKSGFKVIAEAENGEQAVSLALEKNPDIILMDIGMPIMDGITATRLIKAKQPTIKVAMLTSRQDEEEVLASLAAGADAYCMKDIKIDRLVSVLSMVADGGIWLDPPVAQFVLNAMPSSHPATDVHSKMSSQPRRKYNTDLTEREIEVLGLIAKGKSNKEIAEALSITTHTVKVHVGNIIQKLAVDDRTQAAIKAIQDDLVSGRKLDLMKLDEDVD